jgi:hypothetical protein
VHLKSRAREDKIKIRNYYKTLKTEALNKTTEKFKEILNDHIK